MGYLLEIARKVQAPQRESYPIYYEINELNVIPYIYNCYFGIMEYVYTSRQRMNVLRIIIIVLLFRHRGYVKKRR